MDTDGRGLAAGNVRVANLLPGERAFVSIAHVSRHRRGAWGEILERRGELSTSRVEPACPAFGRCGGCRLQHVNRAMQLDFKRARIVAALRNEGVTAPVSMAVPAAHQLGYRNKGKYVIGRDDAGALALGAYEPRSHRLVSTLGCAVVSPAIDRAATCAAQAIEELGLEPYDESSASGSLRYLVVRHGCDERLVATIISRSDAGRGEIAALGERLMRAGGATGIYWAKNDRSDGGLFAATPLPLLGDRCVGEELAGGARDVDPHAFWQINRETAQQIYREIAEALASFAATRVLDAYAGVGAIGLAVAARGVAVTTIEIDEASVRVTREVARRAGLSVTALAGDAAGFDWRGYDAVVVNPPRRGLGGDVCQRLADAAPPHIVYLSCGPESLAKDLAALTTSGYRVSSAKPFDMLPGTTEVETLVILERH